jgi:rhamnosyl/mannosyltransferase
VGSAGHVPPPLVISHHSDIVRQRRVLRLMHEPFERFVYRRAGAILASSPAYRDGSPVLREHADRVRVVPMGIDLRPLANPSARALMFAAQLRREMGNIIWLCVGRCVYYKGLHVALEALRHVRGRLLIIGRGPLGHDLRAAARSLGVAERITWWDWADEDRLAGAYLVATALWFPSTARSEAFGLAQVEAMAAGCPVINTQIAGSGVTWVCPDGESGLTVPVNDPLALARAAQRLLDEPGLPARLAQSAVRRAHEMFDDRAMARQTLSTYRELLDRRRVAEPARRHVEARARPSFAAEFVHARVAPVLGEPVRRH